MSRGEWCVNVGEVLDITSEHSIVPKFVRCPRCNRRLKPSFYDCEFMDTHAVEDVIRSVKRPGSCIHIRVPSHKKRF